MGLNASHGCWDGGYSAFAHFRRALASLIGIDLDKMAGFGGHVPWSFLAPDPLHILLNHSDCDGEIAVEDLLPLADRLDELVPMLENLERMSGELASFGHAQSAREFADGLRDAACLGEPVEFG